MITFLHAHRNVGLVNLWVGPVNPGRTLTNEPVPFAVEEKFVGVSLHHSAVAMPLFVVSMLLLMFAMLLSVFVAYFVVPEVISYLAYLYLGLLFVRTPILGVLPDIAREL